MKNFGWIRKKRIIAIELWKVRNIYTQIKGLPLR